MQKAFFFIALFFTCNGLFAQSLTVQQYIDTYKDLAIREMKRMGVPASITLAQGLLETENGNSVLVKKSNNHFGIKCKSSWSGSSVTHDDDEDGECFRKYNSAEDSYRDHSNFLRGSERYASLFKLAPTDYKGWAYGLKKAGYATNPAYPAILIKSIEDYNLQQYTLMGADDVPVFDKSKYTDDKDEPEVTPAQPEVKVISEETISGDLSGKKMFNGVKAVYVPRGTSVLAVATKYNIPLAKLLDINDMKEDGLLKEDGWIYLERKLAQGKRDFYITEKEESVNSIAQANAIQVSSLLTYNDLKEDELVKPGTKIFLKPAVEKPVADKNEKPVVQENTKIHEVQPKEGLYAISRKYNVSVQELREWNSLTSDDLKIGQKLIIAK